jgi:hypothetical protein
MEPSPVTTLVLQDDEGNSTNLELGGPGGTIRVVVGEPGCESGVWRIWAPKAHSDVYIGIRTILGFQKWSLHESGKWHFAWISDEKASQFTEGLTRFIDQWDQPAEVGETGWTKGFTIQVRHQDLVDAPSVAPPADTIRLPAPPDGHFVGIHVVIARPNQPMFTLKGARPFAGFTLADGRVLLLLLSVEPIADEANQMLDGIIAEFLKQAPNELDLGPQRAVRMALHGHRDEGDRAVWDAALRRPDEPQTGPP